MRIRPLPLHRFRRETCLLSWNLACAEQAGVAWLAAMEPIWRAHHPPGMMNNRPTSGPPLPHHRCGDADPLTPPAAADIALADRPLMGPEGRPGGGVDPFHAQGQSCQRSDRQGFMARQALFPAGARTTADRMKLSPGIISGGHVFLTGMTGSGPDGVMPDDIDNQLRQAFAKIGAVLREAGLGFDAIVEMTTYHVGLRDHFDRFCAIRAEYVTAPYPAWTAVEVAGLRREGAVVEIRVVAALETD